jgi:NAD(P)-dependent dehydrogenase (short-subunit alcohol dehydrogenase family)
MSVRLQNKICLITGTGGSMGRAAALMFSAQGAKIVGCDINSERAEETVRLVQEQGGEMVSIHPCNLTDESECERLIELAVSTFGGIDVIYNNAAMAYMGWIDQISVADFKATINEELNLVFLLCRAAWPHLVKRGGGSIINIGSDAAFVARKKIASVAHSAAKGGVVSMTRQLAMEGGPHQIRANTISPGITESHQTMEYINDPEFWGEVKKSIILGRPGKPEEIAACALYLASDESAWVTGANFNVDGGILAWT